MLDQAAQRVLAWSLDRVSQYLANPSHAFIKPHGSTNWVRRVAFKGSPPTGQEYEAIFRSSEIDDFSDVIEDSAVTGQTTIPALAVPIADKGSFECPDDHFETLRSLIPHVDRIITIGWRGREASFLKMLREDMRSRAAVTVVDRDHSEAEKIGQHLYSNLGSVEIIPSMASGFSGFLALPGALLAAWEGRSPSPAEAG
jgi:hypothetical protein